MAVRVAPGPKGRVFVYGKTEEEADQKAKDLLKSLEPSGPSLPVLPSGSLGRFVYETFVPHVYRGLKAPTVRKYDSLLVNHILPALGLQQIEDIGFESMTTMLQSLRCVDDRKKPLPSTQARAVVALTRQCLSFYWTLQSAKKGVSMRSDWTLVKLPKKPRKKLRSEPEEDFTARILGAARGEWYEGPIFAALFLGLRRGEICGLKWSRIDREKMQLVVDIQLQPETGTRDVETKGETRLLPIPPEILPYLDRLGDGLNAQVFPFHDGRPIPPNELSKVVPRLCREAGLKHRTLHDLRSLCASNMIQLDVDPLTIMEWLGHNKLDTTMIYLDGRSKAKRESLQKALAALQNDVEGVDR